jgi:hypothetical protein
MAALAASAQMQEKHCEERGTAAILTRSAFAHGYRHGYEAGYHEGNIDINMARPARTEPKHFKGLPLGYQDSFGSRKSFESGFALGLKAGYRDGYAGNSFRAVDELRSASDSLADKPIPVDPQNVFFDHGLTAGYQDGFAGGRAEPQSARKKATTIDSVTCSYHPSKPSEAAAEPSYCEGYRRGYVLGHGDGRAIGPEQGLLEASK